MITEQPLWYDVSSHQGEIKYARLAEAKEEVYGIYSRAGCGLNKDSTFERNYTKCGEHNLYRTSYWATWHEYCMNTQLDRWFEQHPTLDGIPRVIDEEHGGAEPEQIAENILHWSDVILSRDGLRPWIYTRANLVEQWLTPYWLPEDLNMHFYILAQYDLDDGKEYDSIVVPDGVHIDRVLMKQTSGRIPPDPLSLSPAPAIDRNRWLHHDVDGMNDFLVSLYFTPDPPDNEFDLIWEELVNINGTINTLGGEINDNKAHIADNASFIQVNKDDIAEHENNIEAITANVSSVLDDITKLKQDIIDVKKEIAKNVVAINKVNKRIDGLAGGHSHWWQRIFK